MDGLMIDSEPLWHVAEQAVFGAAGVELSTEDCNDTTGLRIDEGVAFHAARKPWGDTPTQAEVAAMAAEGEALGQACMLVVQARSRTRITGTFRNLQAEFQLNFS